MRWVVVLVALLSGLAGPAWADFEDGLRAYQQGDYAAAYREWLALAPSGGCCS
jgi:hypothetical protein